MSAHTPGPWFADGARFVRQAIEPRHVICRLPTVRNPGDQQLIASAPRMLAALKLCIAALERGEHCSKEQFDAALNEGHAVCIEIGSPA